MCLRKTRRHRRRSALAPLNCTRAARESGGGLGRRGAISAPEQKERSGILIRFLVSVEYVALPHSVFMDNVQETTAAEYIAAGQRARFSVLVTNNHQ